MKSSCAIRSLGLDVKRLFLVLMIVCAQSCSNSSEPAATDRTTPDDKAAFTDVAAEWNVKFVDRPRDASDYRLSKVMGSGCAILDFDQDSLPDILCLASDSQGKNAGLFRQDGSGKFTDVAERMGLSEASGTGVAVGDCNNDGWPDLYLTSERDDQLWLNDEGAGFHNITKTSGVVNSQWGTAACWVDYNRDGWLDLFVANYVEYSHRPCTRLGGGDADFCGPHLFPPTRDALFRNVTGQSSDGSPRFVDVTASTQIDSAVSAGLGVTAKDFTGDGWIDLYVASDQRPNLLWVNRQGKTFSNEAAARGCDVDFQGRSQASMGLAFGDVSGDGREELIVSHLDGEAHAVYQFTIDGMAQDVSHHRRIGSRTRPFTGFGVAVGDFLREGTAAVLTVNGRVKRSEQSAVNGSFWEPYKQPLQLLVRSPDGYSERTAIAGKFVARGLAIGDLDRDGDLDAVVSCIGDPALVLRNDQPGDGNWLAIKTVDSALGGRSCPGARLSIQLSERVIEQTFQPCQSYAGCHLDEVMVGIADGEVRHIDVTWPHGSMKPERFLIDGLNKSITLSRGRGVVLDN